VAAARARVRNVDPQQPVDEIRTMAAIVSESASFIRMAAALMIVLGLVALLLAAVGLYGVMAEHVARRTHEIGIRMALGARRVDLVRLILGRAAQLTVVGLACGVLAAFALGRLMTSLLFGVVRPDLATLTAVLAAVACAAAWIPMRRATRVDPLLALREE
jgi:putative ABC transport system permease protein